MLSGRPPWFIILLRSGADFYGIFNSVCAPRNSRVLFTDHITLLLTRMILFLNTLAPSCSINLTEYYVARIALAII
jgi:hypothetical protein